MRAFRTRSFRGASGRHIRALLLIGVVAALTLLWSVTFLLRSRTSPNMSYVLFTVIPTSTLPKAALYNSLKSWSMLHSQPRCIVFGPKTLNLRAIYGIDPAKLGMDYFPVLERDLNVGRLPALFPRVIALSGSSMALYVDPLAILTQAFASSLRGALSGLSRERDFVLVGDGYEMQIEQDLPFYYPDWLVQLLESTKVGGCRNFTVLGFTRTAFVKQDIPDTLLSEARDVLGLLRLFNQQHVPVVHIQASPAAPVVIVQAELGATRTPRLSFQPVTGDAPDPTPAGHLQYNYEVFNATRLAPRHLDHGFLAPSFTLVHAPQVLKLAPQDGSPPASNAAENTPHTDAVVLHVAAQRDAAPGRGAVADNLPGEHDFENTGPDESEGGGKKEEKAEEDDEKEDDYLVQHMEAHAKDTSSKQRGTAPGKNAETLERDREKRRIAAQRRWPEHTFTIFATPKPMTDPHIAMIQTNAVVSWSQLNPRPYIILFGDAEGLKELAAKVNGTHVPELTMITGDHPLVDKTGWNKPITPAPALGALFYRAMELAPTKTLVFINGDILLPPMFGDVLTAVNQFSDKFLLLSHRYRKWVHHYIDFGKWDWFKAPWGSCEELDRQKDGRCIWGRDSSRAVDYFAFTRQTYLGVDIKDFAVGRVAYDNWLVYHAALNNATVVGATELLRVVHQNHDYSHLQKDVTHDHRKITGKSWELFHNPLSEYNRHLIYQEAAETGTHPADIVKGDQRFHAFRVVKQKKDCQSTRYWNPNHCKFMLKRINTQDNPRIPRHLKHPPYKCAQSVPPDICKRLEHILK